MGASLCRTGICTTMGKRRQLPKLLPEPAQALLPLHSWKEAIPTAGLHFFLFLVCSNSTPGRGEAWGHPEYAGD